MMADNRRIADRRHGEWNAKFLRWNFLLDSYEGGDEYRFAEYNHDRFGYPIRNLIRHKREYPARNPTDTGHWSSAVGPTTDNDFDTRLSRTPVPSFVKEASEIHLAKIYAQEIRRNLPADLEPWGEDVDGFGNDLTTWMREEVAPLLGSLGNLDVIMGHPEPPDGMEIRHQGDEMAAKTNRVVAAIILPQQMVWWRLDKKRRYVECLVRECDDDGVITFRHWTPKDWTLYDDGSRVIEGPVDHPFKRPPIVRLFVKRSPRFRNVGVPFYWKLAENQKEYYNKDSELILSDSIQAHPLMQGPAEYVAGDQAVPVGPGVVLPKKKHGAGTNESYEGWDVVDFPKGAAESIRQNKADIRDEADRNAGLTKPAGAQGRTGLTVAQSGISKRLDYSEGNDLLSKMATWLEEAEEQLVDLAMTVYHDGNPPAPSKAGSRVYEIVYPREFDLFGPDEFFTLIVELSLVTANMGLMPEVEGDLLKTGIRMLLRGKEDKKYERYDAEVDRMLAQKAKQQAQDRELQVAGQRAALEAPPSGADSGRSESGAGTA